MEINVTYVLFVDSHLTSQAIQMGRRNVCGWILFQRTESFNAELTVFGQGIYVFTNWPASEDVYSEHILWINKLVHGLELFRINAAIHTLSSGPLQPVLGKIKLHHRLNVKMNSPLWQIPLQRTSEGKFDVEMLPYKQLVCDPYWRASWRFKKIELHDATPSISSKSYPSWFSLHLHERCLVGVVAEAYIFFLRAASVKAELTVFGQRVSVFINRPASEGAEAWSVYSEHIL